MNHSEGCSNSKCHFASVDIVSHDDWGSALLQHPRGRFLYWVMENSLVPANEFGNDLRVGVFSGSVVEGKTHSADVAHYPRGTRGWRLEGAEIVNANEIVLDGFPPNCPPFLGFCFTGDDLVIRFHGFFVGPIVPNPSSVLSFQPGDIRIQF